MQADSTLAATTGNRRTDAALRALIATCQRALPQRLRSAYITGSYADGTGLATSDLDATLVFTGSLTADERAAVGDALAREGARSAQVELDLAVADERDLAAGVTPMLKLAARCVWGRDDRAEMPLIAVERWARERMHAAYWLLVNIFERPLPLQTPLTFPREHDEFRGYTQRTVRLEDGSDAPCTRDLLRVTGWAATALVARRGGYVARKRESAAAYRERVGDEHAALLDDLSRWCREQWAYLIPAAAADRARLREMCARTLAFERRFLTEYRDWALGELQSGDAEARHAAACMLGRVPLADSALTDALALAEAGSS
ncbi:MAG: hypothetical protein ACHQ4H_03255 [Ktedonobacterales bacterium]